MQRLILTEVTPILAGIIEDGIREGLFNTPYPYETIEMLIAYTNTVFDDEIVKMTEDEKKRRIAAFIFNLERLLAAPKGTFISIMKAFEDSEKMNKEKVLFRKFMILWLGQFISAIGTGLTSFGLGVYVYELTKKASLVALISLFAFLPSILLGPLAGVLADRYDRRLLMIIGDSFSALGPLFILFSILFGKIELWQIFLGVLISSVFHPF